jgi:phenylalanyl-tRNA synthetase beta chain
MKFSENWLRTFVNPPLTTRELADALTMGGIEVEAIEAAAPAFERVVVGEVKKIAPHPAADRLSVCEVDVGAQSLSIVCGAPNVRPGVRVPTALPGARLPGLEIAATRIRGVESQGMLCSSKELGLSAEAGGLLLLPADAPIGADVRDYLELNDQLLTTKPTPNRGDCLSVLGIAREVAAITAHKITPLAGKPFAVTIKDRLPVKLEAREACPRYCGRLVRGVNARAPTPQWMSTRLAKSGVRSINAIVDITNYVMLELGQPLHAFDAARLAGGIRVRFAQEGERITLLNGEAPVLTPEFLVIADARGAVALAGIMGGLDSAVSESTRDIFLESAFFTPEAIAGKPRKLGFGSDSSYRFERGVDFDGTLRALDRATQLVLEICGGQAGPAVEAKAQLPKRKPVMLRVSRAQKVLGVKLTAKEVSTVFQRLGFEFTAAEDKFRVTPPSYRFDIAIEEDLIEEVARIHGYENIPASAPIAPAVMLSATESRRDAAAIRRLLVARDYQEVVTYSFVEREWETELCGNPDPVTLANPISSQMNVMRSSLIGSLVECVAFNAKHKQTRVRVFEIGRCFVRSSHGEYAQPIRLGCAAFGDLLPEQWGAPARPVDFYDLKGDVEALLAGRPLRFEAAVHPAFHPGKSARIVADGVAIGWIGELHPRWQQKYDLRLAPVLCELDFEHVVGGHVPAYREISKFPPVRRDIAVIVDEGASYQAILEELQREPPAIVADIGLFDVYRGPNLEKGKKSLAFRVLLQDTRKTLTDAEIDAAVSELVRRLERRFHAKLR